MYTFPFPVIHEIITRVMYTFPVQAIRERLQRLLNTFPANVTPHIFNVYFPCPRDP